MSRPDAIGVYRIIDANLNRLREGLRVVEDFCRLGHEDRRFDRFKALRRRLAALVTDDIAARCLSSRGADVDPGRATFGAAEAHREDARAVAVAGFKRAQEAARTIEEYAKAAGLPELARGAKGIRFELYTLEREILGGRNDMTAAWFAGGPHLYLVADERFHVGRDLAADVGRAVDAGVRIVQCRRKSGNDRDFLARAEALAKLCRVRRVPFIVNDRPDIALLNGADGLHLGQDDLPIAAARRVVGDRMVIGRSTHTLEQAVVAAAEGADYIGFGPIFPTSGKENPDPVVGIDGLAAVLRAVTVPVVAIGGIDESNIGAVAATGVPAIAVIRAILARRDPGSAVAELLGVCRQGGGDAAETGGR
ncbi:MAG: thiamine phosphate synthase [Deltaproteobacteria bacterium]|nr:thiamine phosphate synthase [Candidatus Anaeroferrophillacea bacterium]